MFARVAGVCLTLAVVSVAQAGAVVELVPDHSGPYALGEAVLFEVQLSQSPTGDDQLLRYAQFDFTATDPLLSPALPVTFPSVKFWSTDDTCHYIEDDLAGARPNVVSMAYYFADPLVLGPNPTDQLGLPGDGTSMKIGDLQITCPETVGTYDLDVMNAGQADADVGGADIRFGFELVTGVDVLTTWRANTGELTGGSYAVICGGIPPSTVLQWESVAEHARGVGEVGLVIAASDDSTEPRLFGLSKIVVSFDNAIDPTSALPGNVSVDGCDVTDTAIDLSGTTIDVLTQASDTELVIEFDPALPDYARYLIALPGILGGDGAALLGDADRVVYALVGDANGDRRVAANDVGGARSLVGTDPIDPTDPASGIFQVRSDANKDGRIAANDVGGIRSMVGNDARSISCP